jgi:hypothetical protein
MALITRGGIVFFKQCLEKRKKKGTGKLWIMRHVNPFLNGKKKGTGKLWTISCVFAAKSERAAHETRERINKGITTY